MNVSVFGANPAQLPGLLALPLIVFVVIRVCQRWDL